MFFLQNTAKLVALDTMCPEYPTAVIKIEHRTYELCMNTK